MALAARLRAAESGWLRSPDNDHASIRLRADTSANGETRLLLDVKLENGWKTYWRAGEGGVAPSIARKGDMPEVSWFWPTPRALMWRISPPGDITTR